MNNPVRKHGVKTAPLPFARHTAGASRKTRAPRECRAGHRVLLRLDKFTDLRIYRFTDLADATAPAATYNLQLKKNAPITPACP
ncbi:MAG: hypothetical protein LBG31_02365 [Prevotellaceae bacterium]|nr:hypothetical protein [Prevotellaceae bacterium]